MNTSIVDVNSEWPANNDVGCPPCNKSVACPLPSEHAGVAPMGSSATLGRHLARRLVEVGVGDVFSVPGDFNLTLLDHLLAEPGLNLIGCCNELNAGYAADGYARSRGVGACVVTFTVGGLSVINAIAGAYSENLPVICIVGGPNSNDYGTNRILHHTIGLPDFSQEYRCFQTVTCAQVIVNHLDDAQELIDYAISTALIESKPVYISISCNLAGVQHPTFSRQPVPYCLSPRLSNPQSLEAAVEITAEFLNAAVKPVLVGGPKMRVAKAKSAFVELANASGYPVAVMPAAKGQVPETHPHFIGTYWGAVSTAFCAEIVESADAYLFAGPIFNDYSSVGYSLLLKKEKAIIVQPNRVTVANGPTFGCVLMKDFLEALAKKVKHNPTSLENYRRIFVPDGVPLKSAPNEPLRVNVLFKHIQGMLTDDTAVIAETGDSWFNCQKLKLPEKCGYEFQMQYGSIGWSVGATLGYAQATPEKRLISCIGDGSFQVTVQDVSTMIRNGQNPIIFLINNGGYTIEVQIHDGPYNVIKNWNYTGLVDAIHNGEGKRWTAKSFIKRPPIMAVRHVGHAKETGKDVGYARRTRGRQVVKLWAHGILHVEDLVVLSGGHTIGVGLCNFFSNRLYNFTGKGDMDPSLDKSYAEELKNKCTSLADNTTTVPMDPGGSLNFDRHYYSTLESNRGLFQSDAALLTDSTSKSIAEKQLEGDNFIQNFKISIQRMGSIGVLTGSAGEIRKRCAFVN